MAELEHCDRRLRGNRERVKAAAATLAPEATERSSEVWKPLFRPPLALNHVIDVCVFFNQSFLFQEHERFLVFSSWNPLHTFDLFPFRTYEKAVSETLRPTLSLRGTLGISESLRPSSLSFDDVYGRSSNDITSFAVDMGPGEYLSAGRRTSLGSHGAVRPLELLVLYI